MTTFGFRFFPMMVVVVVAIGGCRTSAPVPNKNEKKPPVTSPNTKPVADSPAPAGQFHTVKKGDTLWAIASKHHVPVEELIEVNGLEANGLIAPGQLIFIPDDDPLALERPKVVEGPAPIDTSESAPVTTTADLMWPIAQGVILRDFSRAKSPYDGLLFAAPAGTPISAADDGKVLYVGDEGSAFGTVIIVEHPKALVTVYAHLDGVDVEAGQKLKRGEIIGRVGSSGRAESPQLHFQVRQDRKPVNPLTRLPPP